MEDTIDDPALLDGRGRIYQLNSQQRLLNLFYAAVFVIFAVLVVSFGCLGASPNSLKVVFAAIATASLFGALYSVRFNQLATFLYPDRIISRGLFTQGSLHRDDIPGYKLIPSRGPPRLKLIPKNPQHRPVYLNKVCTDATFENWLSELPDLILMPQDNSRHQG